ncbi:hypothetical protein Val02_72650 [Virgisporangium aliadipatigenens]|uniref:Uncharacterized protein n=1 Tax=Virgisporangium aliadipatigenens TaxID=741659 RepID=A0A8J4DU28_9ACTN|nr:hypothetical protein Val02_72650 [Virgisporangium aliadipatigenens]
MLNDDVVQVPSASHPEWIYPFSGLRPAQFRRLARLVAAGLTTRACLVDHVEPRRGSGVGWVCAGRARIPVSYPGVTGVRPGGV